MAITLRVGPRQVSDLEKLCALSTDDLSRLVDTLNNLSPAPIDPSKTSSVFRDVLEEASANTNLR